MSRDKSDKKEKVERRRKQTAESRKYFVIVWDEKKKKWVKQRRKPLDAFAAVRVWWAKCADDRREELVDLVEAGEKEEFMRVLRDECGVYIASKRRRIFMLALSALDRRSVSHVFHFPLLEMGVIRSCCLFECPATACTFHRRPVSPPELSSQQRLPCI